MNIIDMPRQSGKTTLLVEKVEKNKKAVLITFCHRDKSRILELHPKLKGRVFSMGEVIQGGWSGRERFEDAYIDELDLCLESLIRLNIKEATRTGEDLK